MTVMANSVNVLLISDPPACVVASVAEAVSSTRPSALVHYSREEFNHAGQKLAITLQKFAKEAGENHEQVVKVTVDKTGQMLKLAVSK